MTNIPGIKLIKHNAAGVFEEDDASFPFKLEASFSPPDFMAFTFVMIHGGSEDIVVRGMRSLTITGPVEVIGETG